MLPKFSRHSKRRAGGEEQAPRSDNASTAILHSLRTGTRLPPRPPRKKKNTGLAIPRRQRALTSLGFCRSEGNNGRKSKIIFSSDDEVIFVAAPGSTPISKQPSQIKTPTHQTKLLFHSIKIDVNDLCSALHSGTCLVLHTLKLDSCPIGLTAAGDILEASHKCPSLANISLNGLNGSKNRPLTSPAARSLAGKAIAQGLINSTTIVSASLRDNNLGHTFANTLKKLVKESQGKVTLSRLDITGNPSATAIEIGDVACYFRNLKMGYSDLHRAKGGRFISQVVESAENYALVQNNNRSKCHPLALFDCSMCGLSDRSAGAIQRLLLSPKLCQLTTLDISRNRLEGKAALSIAEALVAGTPVRTLIAGYQFFGLEGTLAILDACIGSSSIKHLHLENTAPLHKQQVWERSILLMLIDRPSMVNVVVEWPRKKPGRLMQHGNNLCLRSSFFEHRKLVCDGRDRFCKPVARKAARSDIMSTNIGKLCSNEQRSNALQKLISSLAMKIFSIFQYVCLDQEEDCSSIFSLHLNGWSRVVHKCLKMLPADDESSASSSSDSEDEDDGRSTEIAQRIFRACRFHIDDDPAETPSLKRPQWIEALVRLSMLHFKSDTPATAVSRFLEEGLFKCYHSVVLPDFWRKRLIYSPVGVEHQFTKKQKARQVLIDIYVRYAHKSGPEVGHPVERPRGLTFSRWLVFLRQFKLFDSHSFTKRQAKYPFVRSLPISIDINEHCSGFKSTELAFCGFLEALARMSEILSQEKLLVKIEHLRLVVSLKHPPCEIPEMQEKNDDDIDDSSNDEMHPLHQNITNMIEYLQLKAQTVL